MSASSVKRSIIAIFAAVAVSAGTIGATVSPAQASTIHAVELAHG